MEKNKLDKTFKHYLEIFTEDKELGKILNKVSYDLAQRFWHYEPDGSRKC